MAASTAQTGFSATFAIGDGEASETFTVVAEVTSVTPPGYSRDALEATHLTSDDGYREYIAGLRDGGEATISGNHLAANRTAMIAAVDAGLQNYRIADPDGDTYTFAGIVTAYQPGEMTPGDVIGFTATVKVSGKPTIVAA